MHCIGIGIGLSSGFGKKSPVSLIQVTPPIGIVFGIGIGISIGIGIGIGIGFVIGIASRLTISI